MGGDSLAEWCGCLHPLCAGKERKGNLCYLQHMSQGASGTYDHREKLQRSDHLLETSPHESDLPWDVPGLDKNSSPAGCAHYQD